MQIGYAQKREMAVQQDGESKKISYYEMNIRTLFGTTEKFTLSRNKSDNENAPYFNIYAYNNKGWIKRKLKAGALWLKSTDDGTQFMAGHIETPLVDGGKMQISLWRAKPLFEGESVDWEYDVVWKPYTPPKEDQQPVSTQREIPVTVMPTDITINEDEIPF